MNFRTWSLEKRFAYLSFFVILILGVLLSSVTIWFNKKEMVRATIYYVEQWFYSTIEGRLTKEDFEAPLDKGRLSEIDKFMQSFVLDDKIRKIKIWNLEGRVVYSDNHRIINQVPPLEDDLQHALEGETYFELTDVSKEYADNASDGENRMIEVYLPVKDPKTGVILGAYEFYVWDPVLTAQLISHNKIIWVTVTISLGILFLALQKVIRHASSTIRKQGGEIEVLSKQLEKNLTWKEKSQVGTIKALMAALDAKDNYTAGHCLRVKLYAERTGRELGLTGEQLKRLGEACLFHDIGKIGVPEVILNKPDKLTAEEFDLIKSHSNIGANIIGSIHYFAEHVNIIRYHHERMDCKGYPEGICFHKVPYESKILAVADTYDALTSDRPYRKGVSKEKALKILQESKGSQLDPDIVEAFIKVIGQGYNSSSVQANDEQAVQLL